MLLALDERSKDCSLALALCWSRDVHRDRDRDRHRHWHWVGDRDGVGHWVWHWYWVWHRCWHRYRHRHLLNHGLWGCSYKHWLLLYLRLCSHNILGLSGDNILGLRCNKLGLGCHILRLGGNDILRLCCNV